jgi:hypothetical protein
VDTLELPVGYILNDIAELIEPSLPVRREATRARGDYAPEPDHPITGPEMRAFLSEFVSRYPYIGEAVLTKPESHVVEIPAALYDRFLERIFNDAGHSNWLGADGPHYIRITKHFPEIHRRKSSDVPVGDKSNPVIEAPVRMYAPSLNVILALFRRRVDLNALNWRQLEEVIAELLKTEGYDVELGRGSKDSGADIIAHMTIPTIGYVRTVWQAKHFANGNKVGLSIVRELADVRNELNATKAFIVTSSFLTRGALERIHRDEYQLGKLERPELETWINKTLGGHGT